MVRFDYVVGLFYYEEEGHNFQNDTAFNCGTKAAPCTSPTPAADFFLHQKYDSKAIYANVGFHLTDAVPASRPASGRRRTTNQRTRSPWWE